MNVVHVVFESLGRVERVATITADTLDAISMLLLVLPQLTGIRKASLTDAADVGLLFHVLGAVTLQMACLVTNNNLQIE